MKKYVHGMILMLLLGSDLSSGSAPEARAELPTEVPAHSQSISTTGDYGFDRALSREVLEKYLSRSITMEGLLNGRGDLEDNIRMLKSTGAKFVGRALCLWGGEGNLLRNLERARLQLPRVLAADPDMVLQACLFEIVTTQVEQVPVPAWAFVALGRPAEARNFHYADMLYPDGQLKDHWGKGQSVPDVSRPETKLWFYFLGASFINVGCEAIHLGQTELMNHNDPNLDHYAQVLALIRSHATRHARRHMVLLDSHVPSGGLVRDGQLLMDFHSFPLRIKEVPGRPQHAILEMGHSDGIYGRSKGGMTFSGWECAHLPYLVEIDNWGSSRTPGRAHTGGIWIWGYDEISWFANQDRAYRADWLRYAWHWVRDHDPNGFLQMPGSRTVRSPLNDLRWYHANSPSPSVPTGFNDEEAIRSIWARDQADDSAPTSETEAGWRPLFDGKTTRGWRGYRMEEMPPGWQVIDGAMVRVSGGAGGKGAGGGDDIVTVEQFDNFELRLEWKIVDRAGNSGLIIRATEDASTSWHTGPEMQILDNAAYPDRDVRQLAGACYDLYAPAQDASRPRGEWNAVRIVADGAHVEHWLNDTKLLEYELGSHDWNQRVSSSKFKNMKYFQEPSTRGHICLQDHTARIEYRNIEIRPLPHKP